MNRTEEASDRTEHTGVTISVAIPAYNSQSFISRAIRSALDQTLPPLEVIVVDDASTDDTCVTIEGLIENDARVRLIKLVKNGGPSVARNAAFDAAKGDWIAILDADDVYLPSRLEALLKVATTYKADIIADNIGLYDFHAQRKVSDGVKSFDEVHVIDRYEYVSRCRGNRKDIDWGLLHPMFRRAFLKGRNLKYPTNLRHGEDFVFVLSALLEDARFVFTPEVGYLYTQRFGAYSNISSGMSRTRVDFETMVRHTISLLDNPKVRTDRAMADLLRLRCHALRAIDVQCRMPTYLRERDFLNIIKLLTYDIEAWPVLLKAIKGKASAFMGLR